MSFLDYPLLFLLALIQTSFLSLNLLLAFILFLLMKKGFFYTLPRMIVGSLLLALLGSASIGLLLLSFSLVFSLATFLKARLPAAFFIRASLVILALPVTEILYQELVFFFKGF